MSPVLLVASIIFGVFLIFFAVYSFFLVYHLYEFSMNMGSSLILICTYLITAGILSAVVLFVLSQTTWDAPAFTFFQI